MSCFARDAMSSRCAPKRMVYGIRMTRDCLRVSQRLRKLYKLSTGGSMTMGGWYEQFLRDALARQEQYCRNNGIPIPPEEDDVAPPGAGAKFTGLVDDSPVVDE